MCDKSTCGQPESECWPCATNVTKWSTKYSKPTLGAKSNPIVQSEPQTNHMALGQKNYVQNPQDIQDPHQINSMIEQVLNNHGFDVGFYNHPYFVSPLIMYCKLNYQEGTKYPKFPSFLEKLKNQILSMWINIK